GESKNDIGSSEYVHKIKGVEYSSVPAFDIDAELNVQQAVAALIKNKIIKSAHDISEGGLMATLLEKGFNRNLGFDVAGDASVRKDAYWFGEAQSRVLVSVSADKTGVFEYGLNASKTTFTKLGTVTSGDIIIDAENWGNIAGWKDKYDTVIENIIAGKN
ncbi:MAG TPA: AIR synthase-related protein, partial [Arachidicoccus sp.]